MTSTMHTDIGAYIAGFPGLEEATITAGAGNDGVAVNGGICDLQGLFLPQGYLSVALLVTWKCTLASTKTLSIAGKLQHGAQSNLSDAADYGNALATTVVATGVQTALRGCTTINVGDLRGAKRYIRPTITADLSAAGTDTVLVGCIILLGGPTRTPASY